MDYSRILKQMSLHLNVIQAGMGRKDNGICIWIDSCVRVLEKCFITLNLTKNLSVSRFGGAPTGSHINSRRMVIWNFLNDPEGYGTKKSRKKDSPKFYQHWAKGSNWLFANTVYNPNKAITGAIWSPITTRRPMKLKGFKTPSWALSLWMPQKLLFGLCKRTPNMGHWKVKKTIMFNITLKKTKKKKEDRPLLTAHVQSQTGQIEYWNWSRLLRIMTGYWS